MGKQRGYTQNIVSLLFIAADFYRLRLGNLCDNFPVIEIVRVYAPPARTRFIEMQNLIRLSFVFFVLCLVIDPFPQQPCKIPWKTKPAEFLVAGLGNCDRCMTTRQYARLVSNWIASIGLDLSFFGTHSFRRTKASSSIGLPGIFAQSS